MREEIIGDCRLILGDCEQAITGLQGTFSLLTDPPYGIGQDGGRGHRLRSKAKVQEKRNWDSVRPSRQMFEALLEKTEEQIIWGGNYFADLLPPKMGWLYWQKMIGGDFSDGELAWTSRDRALKEFSYRKTNSEMEHPTQKPLALIQWCLGFLSPHNIILDPFMGSGTTGVACALTGQSFVGIEREESYFDIACRRIEKAYEQPRLFSEPVVKAVQKSFL